ncbi:hypothetical protein LRS73_07895 [Methylobacterium currus]|uniref:hypothetical protein n=1 Tax=Methylobacterium currus TaxID=2051553 RepID=UPI001E656624|nr:hypothetical protein [Methylobacterium currus]UHC17774.1 hypothetical protein LRS73_07895 [Methylobacterium currus]
MRVRASADAILAAVSAYRTDSDPVFRRTIALREWPMRVAGRLAHPRSEAPPPFGIDNFTLMERGSREIVYGLAGRFWRPDFDLVPRADGRDLLALNEPGLAKLALNFAIDPTSEDLTKEDVTILSTETRIVCVDRSARRRSAPDTAAPSNESVRRRGGITGTSSVP